MNWIKYDLPDIMPKKNYERTLEELSNNPQFQILKDHDRLTKAICIILNAETMTELSQKLSKIINANIPGERISYAIKHEYQYLKPYLEDGKFEEGFEMLKEMLRYIRQNIVNKNVLTKLEYIKKFNALIKHMSLKYGHQWWNDNDYNRLFDHFLRVKIAWRWQDNSKGAIESLAAQYFNTTNSDNNYLYKQSILINAHNLILHQSEDEVNKLMESYKKGFEIIKYFYLNGIFNLPECIHEEILNKFIVVFHENHKLLKREISPSTYLFFNDILSDSLRFKISACNILKSKVKSQFNNRLAMFIRTSRLLIEYYEMLITPYIHSTSFYSKTMEISEKLILFVKRTNVLLEWPIKIESTEIRLFLDDLLNTYGENWLRYVDPFFQFGIYNFKMTKLMNNKLANSFRGVESDEHFITSVGLSEYPESKQLIKKCRHFILDARASINMKETLKLFKDLLAIYKDLDEIGVMNYIKTPVKKCDVSKHKFIGKVLEFWKRNKNMLSNTVLPIMRKLVNWSISPEHLAKWISEYLCILLESSEEDFYDNYFGYIGTLDTFYYGTIANNIIKISKGNKDNDFTRFLEIWKSVLEGYEQIRKMKANGEKTDDIIAFVENDLRNITASFGPYWTMELNIKYNYRYQFHYRFSDSYHFKNVATALVETSSVEAFNDKMGFVYQPEKRSSKVIFSIVETLIDNDWRKLIHISKEFGHLIFEFGHTSAMRNMIKLFYVN
ncbi:DgyrCDS14843 [Dimorphilus gyrociliatus]|nr:DgyrCDS14843 [Dimorphilus gyrociliatus]